MNKSMILHIKSLVLMAVLALPVGVMLSSCSSDNDPFFTANEDDYPVILNPDLVTNEEWKNGEPPVLTTINRKENFVYEAIVTPAHYTTITWFIDDVQVIRPILRNVNYPFFLVGNQMDQFFLVTVMSLIKPDHKTLIVTVVRKQSRFEHFQNSISIPIRIHVSIKFY